ncbi:hypothetical protein [Undibacterium pigrum]|uniref:hypothetical protein n=1 Tax=Undibacterium pigrum TaxID=401470 RepID=UPI001474B292|nr:hypothetical protein [Undibacterium pigrum]
MRLHSIYGYFFKRFFFLPYASGFALAILLSLRPGPVAVTVLIVLMVTALLMAIPNTRGAGGNGSLDIILLLFILVLAYAGLLVGFVTRWALWFFFSSSTSRSHKWRRSAIMLTSLMFLPGLLLLLI